MSHEFKIGVAISCYIKHIEVLNRLLDSIQNNTVKPDIVSISSSSMNDEICPINIDNWSFKIIYKGTKNKLITSQNRNIALLEILKDNDIKLVNFIDADDIMHPQRIEIILNAFSKYKDAKILLHNFTNYTKNQVIEKYDIENINISYGILRKCHTGCAKRHDNKPIRLHHAHSTVSVDVLRTVKYRENINLNGKEDSIFCGDILDVYPNDNIYISNSLSYYDESRSYLD